MSQLKSAPPFTRDSLNCIRNILSKERSINTVYETTKALTSFGISVVPIPLGAKSPKGLLWEEYKNRIATPAELEAWFKNKNINYGIVCGRISGFVVVDVDDIEALDWCLRNLPPPMFKCKSGKGEHWYYKYPKDGGVVNNKSRFKVNNRVLKIDIRADGGLIVGPGSTHASGVTYELI